MRPFLQSRCDRSEFSDDIYPFVVVAFVQASLESITEESRRLSLTAKNARALALRIGDTARGFKALTDFIDELAHKTLDTGVALHALSREVVANASASGQLGDYLHRVARLDVEALPAGLALDGRRATQREHADALIRGLHEIKERLDEIRGQLRGAPLIAATSRIEAARLSEGRAQLETISHTIEAIAGAIDTAIRHSIALVAELP